MSRKPIIRQARAEDRDNIISFFNETEIPYIRDRAYWIWLNRIVTTDYSIVAVAEYNESIIAHYAIVPLDMNIKGRKIRIRISGQNSGQTFELRFKDLLQTCIP